MNTNWTPGPWSYPTGDTINTLVFAPPSTARKDLPHGHLICRVDFGGVVSGNYSNAERKANAHLIAAAPELYEALKTIVSDFDHIDRDLPQMVAARAALAKARGES